MNKENTTRPPLPAACTDDIDSYDYLSGSASAQDCTGLIPSAPLSEAELEAYEAVCPYQPPKAAGNSVPSALTNTRTTDQTR